MPSRETGELRRRGPTLWQDRPMTQWKYRWRTTYYVRTNEKGEEYVFWPEYAHVWKPDLTTEVPFPDQDGIDALGALGFELVTITSTPVNLLTRSTSQGDSYGPFPTFTLWFKSPQ
jgi:hypothetical protein